jgi:hypothetical protein
MCNVILVSDPKHRDAHEFVKFMRLFDVFPFGLMKHSYWCYTTAHKVA